jgi:hypothetical protein
VDHEDRLDLWIVMRVVAREHADRAAVVKPEARRRVAHALAHDPRQQEREQVDSGAAADWGGIPVVLAEEARAAHHVYASLGHCVLQAADLVGIVLQVPVDLDEVLIAVLLRIGEASLDRAADAEVERVTHDARPGRSCDRGRTVRGSVIHHEHVEVGRRAVEAAHDLAHTGGLVVRRHNGDLGCFRHEAHSVVLRNREASAGCARAGRG